MARATVLPFELSDFDAPLAREPDRRAAPAHAETPPTRDADALEAVRAESFAAGRRAALEERETETAALDALAANLAESLARLDAALAEERRMLRNAATAFLTRFAEGLAAARETEIAAGLVDRLLAASDDRAPARLFLNPDSVTALTRPLRETLAARGAADFIEIAADNALAPGECRLVWRGGAGARLLNPALAELDAALRGEIAAPETDGAGWRPLRLSMEVANEHA